MDTLPILLSQFLQFSGVLFWLWVAIVIRRQFFHYLLALRQVKQRRMR